MASMAEIEAALERAGAGAEMSALIGAVVEESKKAPQSKGFQPSNSTTGQKQPNAVCFPATVMSMTSGPTKGFNGGPPGVKTDYTLLVESFGNTAIDSDTGHRNPDGTLTLFVRGQQTLTKEQKEAADKEAAEKDLRTKKKTSTYVSNKKEFICDTEDVPPILRVSVFRVPFTHPENKIPFRPGARVLISGLLPIRKFKANADPSIHELEFPTQWQIGNMVPNPNPGANASILQVWTNFYQQNYVVNFYKGPGGGWSPNFMTETDLKMILDWEKEGTLEKNKSRKAKFYLEPSQRQYVARPLVFPLGTNARRQPWHLGLRYSVFFEKISFSDVWSEARKQDERPLRLCTLQAEVVITKKVYTNKVIVERALLELKLNDRFDPDLFNRFGVVNPACWAEVGKVLVPHCGGYLIGTLQHQNTETSLLNEPQNNPRDETGKPAKGYHYFASYSQMQVEPDLACIIEAPSCFEVNLECVKFACRAVIATDDPSSLAEHKWAPSNPLNQGKKLTVNMFETQEKPESLAQKGYRFFLLYPVEPMNRGNLNRGREVIVKKKLDPVEVMSALFMTPPGAAIDDANTDNITIASMPRPDFESKPDACVLFAIHPDEVERIRKGVPQLTADEFARAVIEIRDAEDKKYGGPLVPNPNPEAAAPGVQAAPPPAHPAVAQTQRREDSMPRRSPSVEKSDRPKRGGARGSKKAAGRAAPPPEEASIPEDDDFAQQ